MKSILIPAFTMAAAILTLNSASPPVVHAAEEEGGIGWCGWFDNGDFIEHSFAIPHYMQCMTGKHAKKIPGLCTSGGTTHVNVQSSFCA